MAASVNLADEFEPPDQQAPDFLTEFEAPESNEDARKSLVSAVRKSSFPTPVKMAAEALLTGGKWVDAAISVAGPLAGGVIGQAAIPAPIAGAVAGGAAGSAAAESLIQMREALREERDKPSYGRLAAATAIGAIPLPGVKAASTALRTVGKTAATRAAQGAGLGTAQDVAAQFIDTGEVDINQALDAGLVGAATGAAFGGIEGGIRMAPKARAVAEPPLLSETAPAADVIAEPEPLKSSPEARPDFLAEFDAPETGLIPSDSVIPVPEPVVAKMAEAPAATKAVDPIIEKVIGIKNESVDAELAAMGKPAATHGQKLTMQAALDEASVLAKEDPKSGQRLADDLFDNPRPITGREDAILTYEMTRLSNERDLADDALRKAIESGDEAKIQVAQQNVDEVQNAYQRTAEVATMVGTENAQGLALRKMMLKQDYTLAAMERRISADMGGEKPAPEVVDQIRTLNEKIAATQKAFDDYVAKRTAEVEPERVRARSRPPSRITAALTEQAQAARARIKARMAEGRQMSGLDPADLADHAIIGAEYISKGIDEFADWSKAMIDDFGEAIRPHLKSIYDEAGSVFSNEKRLESLKARVQKRTDEIRARIEAGDVDPKKKPAPIHLDEEANRLQAEYEAAKAEFDDLREKILYQRKTKFQKVSTGAADIYDAARLLMTTGEFSFILRQGKMAVLSRPLTAIKALPDTFKALAADPVAAHAINLKILNHPEIGLAKAAKLHVLDESKSLNKQEEALMGRLAGSIPLVKRFNQAGIVFLNRLRFDMFQQMRQASGGLNAMERVQLAKFINQATGRGSLGKFEPAAVNLARVMFAPRYLASRIQLATGQSMWGGTMRTRRIIAKEYAKTLTGLALYYSLLKMAFDSEERPAEIGTNPRSSDFGKVKIGNTRLDPLAGLSQVIVFGARTATGERTTAGGKTYPLRGDKVPYGGDRWSDIAANFARSKLHPVPGTIINLFDGTDLAGNEATAINQAGNMVAPLTYMDIYEALQEQDLPEGVALSLLALLGEGLQTYEKR